MREEGLVETRTNADDARITDVLVTPKGEELTDRIQQATKKIYVKGYTNLTDAQPRQAHPDPAGDVPQLQRRLSGTRNTRATCRSATWRPGFPPPPPALPRRQPGRPRIPSPPPKPHRSGYPRP